MSFTAKEALFLYESNLIPQSLITGWKKSSGDDPMATAEKVRESCLYRKVSFYLAAFFSIIPLNALASYLTGKMDLGIFAGLGSIYVFFLLLGCLAWRDDNKYIRAFTAVGGFGHDLFELHHFAPGILRTGSDPNNVRNCYVSAMKGHALKAEKDGSAEAVAEIEKKFDCGTRFFLNPTLKGGWRQFLAEKKPVKTIRTPCGHLIVD